MHYNVVYRLVVLFVSLVHYGTATDVINPDITLKNAERNIDITSQVTKISNKLVLENNGKTPIKNFLFAVDDDARDNLAFLSAQNADSSKSSLKFVASDVQGHGQKTVFRVELNDALQPTKTLAVEIETVFTHQLKAHPATITQKEKQLVLYHGNHYLYSPYVVVKQSTLVNLGSRNVENYSKLEPALQSDTTISYGPYEKIQPFSVEKMVIHYENNSPFLTVTRLTRVMEVSHWGNIAVEETIDLEHTGAVLKGPFSHYEYQREAQSGLSSIKSFKTVLPAAAADVYYRDEIGNISTSHMKVMTDSVELDLRPRFPLFGGWKTHYTVGYNVPSYEYLFNAADDYLLKMRFVDHIYDDMIVDHVVTKVILPEGAHDIQLVTPYATERLPDTLHFTYLDTKGRPVITLSKRNLVENHIQDFELQYAFPRILMLQEPLLVVIAFYLLFLLVIVYVRLDFSNTKVGMPLPITATPSLTINMHIVIKSRPTVLKAKRPRKKTRRFFMTPKAIPKATIYTVVEATPATINIRPSMLKAMTSIMKAIPKVLKKRREVRISKGVLINAKLVTKKTYLSDSEYSNASSEAESCPTEVESSMVVLETKPSTSILEKIEKSEHILEKGETSRDCSVISMQYVRSVANCSRSTDEVKPSLVKSKRPRRKARLSTRKAYVRSPIKTRGFQKKGSTKETLPGPKGAIPYSIKTRNRSRPSSKTAARSPIITRSCRQRAVNIRKEPIPESNLSSSKSCLASSEAEDCATPKNVLGSPLGATHSNARRRARRFREKSMPTNTTDMPSVPTALTESVASPLRVSSPLDALDVSGSAPRRARSSSRESLLSAIDPEGVDNTCLTPYPKESMAVLLMTPVASSSPIETYTMSKSSKRRARRFRKQLASSPIDDYDEIIAHPIALASSCSKESSPPPVAYTPFMPSTLEPRVIIKARRRLQQGIPVATLAETSASLND